MSGHRTPPQGAVAGGADARKAVFEAVERHMPMLWELARFLHANPELSNQEFEAHERLTTLLDHHGFDVGTKVANLPTAFVARPRRPASPMIAFIAEYDALPDLGHACGHNLIAASAVGAAIALREALPELENHIMVVGTPSEEVPTDPPVKQQMLDAGCFEPADVVLMMHGSDRTTTGAGTLAIDHYEFEFHGTPSHASKYPHLGRSALDGALLTMQALEFLREHVRQDVRIHGIVSHGGARPNIVPEYAKLEYYVRSLDRGYLESLEPRIRACAEAGALATDTSTTIRRLGSNDNKLLLSSLDEVLLDDAVAAGAVQVMAPEKELGSTDFGNVSHRIPAATLKVGFVPEKTSGHTRAWTEASGDERGHAAIAVAAKAMAATAVKLIGDPGFLGRVRDEFEREVQRQAELAS